MRALTVGRSGDVAVADLAEPEPAPNDLLVEALAFGVCGTDRSLMAGVPRMPTDQDRMILGHESLGRVIRAPHNSGFTPGELVVGTVRRPDPVPCRACGAGESDLCENGGHTSRGISRNGYAAERYALDPEFAVRVDGGLGLTGVLTEPTSIVVKAWVQIDRLLRWPAQRVLVLGAGPIGLLAALCSRQRGCDVQVVDLVDHGRKPDLTRALGAAYYTSVDQLDGLFDAVLECTGVLTMEAVRRTAPGGVTCLVGAGHADPKAHYGISDLANELIRYNKIVVGTVNSNRKHFEAAHEVLVRADSNWLSGMFGPIVELDDWHTAVAANEDQIKAVVQFNRI